jgi:hypothetical protein
MSLAFESSLGTSTVGPFKDPTRRVEISVVFTTLGPTLRALRRAADLARRLRGRIALVVPQIVPFPLPLATPPVLLDFNERRFFALADETHVETVVRIYLCRDRADCLKDMLKPHSIVFLGLAKRWWPTADARLAAQLQRLNHDVVRVEAE